MPKLNSCGSGRKAFSRDAQCAPLDKDRMRRKQGRVSGSGHVDVGLDECEYLTSMPKSHSGVNLKTKLKLSLRFISLPEMLARRSFHMILIAIPRIVLVGISM